MSFRLLFRNHYVSILFNQRASLVNDVIEGTIIASPWNNLARLESDPAIRVVVRRDLNKNNVAVISGGGAGHEPAHVGFIGKGMLTAAVCGDLFASPSVDAVLTAIQAVTGEAGCLLIVKNYTGDRLNFGLAAEKARRLGYNVEMLIVGDDISLPDNKQPRGIAGPFWCIKWRAISPSAASTSPPSCVKRNTPPAIPPASGWRWPAATCRRKPTARRAIRPVTPSWEWASTVSRAPRRSPRKTVQKSLT